MHGSTFPTEFRHKFLTTLIPSESSRRAEFVDVLCDLFLGRKPPQSTKVLESNKTFNRDISVVRTLIVVILVSINPERRDEENPSIFPVWFSPECQSLRWSELSTPPLLEFAFSSFGFWQHPYHQKALSKLSLLMCRATSTLARNYCNWWRNFQKAIKPLARYLRRPSSDQSDSSFHGPRAMRRRKPIPFSHSNSTGSSTVWSGQSSHCHFHWSSSFRWWWGSPWV